MKRLRPSLRGGLSFMCARPPVGAVRRLDGSAPVPLPNFYSGEGRAAAASARPPSAPEKPALVTRRPFGYTQRLAKPT